MLELVTAMGVLGVAFAMYSGTSIASQRQRQINRETAIASDAAQKVLESMRSESFATLHKLYGRAPQDDPGGPGTAPGAAFDAEGLEPVENDADRRVGEILLPEFLVDKEKWQLREDRQLPELGLPRDLNGDSRIDDLDHTSDYFQLPVRVKV